MYLVDSTCVVCSVYMNIWLMYIVDSTFVVCSMYMNTWLMYIETGTFKFIYLYQHRTAAKQMWGVFIPGTYIQKSLNKEIEQ